MPNITQISTALPAFIETNGDLAIEFPEWSVEKIASKTGINQRHIAGPNEFTSDLAVSAARQLFENSNCKQKDVDFLLLVTQSPDFALPSTACLVHEELSLDTSVGAIDLNMGCSGYIYGLRFASSLIASGQAETVLLLTADTYSKYLNPKDKTVRTIFGDGATASIISNDTSSNLVGFHFGTNGKGAGSLIVPNGGLRSGNSLTEGHSTVQRNLPPHNFDLYMHGSEIFNFTLDIAGDSIVSILSKASLQFDEINHFVFHQANAFMLRHLREKLQIPKEKFPIEMAEWGNTVSSTIPMALAEMRKKGTLKSGDTCLLLGFGVGLSWAGCIFVEE
jgi:3-oxoacyl-[acyl-carrier-protein] synthase-3